MECKILVTENWTFYLFYLPITFVNRTMMNAVKITLLLLLFNILANVTLAQVKGDEDTDMTNSAKLRDQKAIDEAMNGWWAESKKTHENRVEWWREARFGMFIHWGVYSVPGGEWKGKKVSGYSEHLMRKERIFRAEYLQLAHQFNPVDFNADEWIGTAKAAGMKYFIITAKHHDGFAMYDSKVSDFNIMQQTPFKRDPMAELAAACRKQGMKFGFYYSHAFDWEHPDAPGNDWEYNNPGGDSLLHGGTNWFDVHPELLPMAVYYINTKAIPQIQELILKYHPDILWFDTPHKIPLSENLRILKMIRETDLNVVVNGRLARSSSVTFGDYKNTADRPAEFFPVDGDWEAIPTTNESYGYSKSDNSHKPAAFFIRLLANAASRGGNLLMNIGPMGNGKFDARDTKILSGIGKWMNVNSEAIYGTTVSPLPLQNWGVSTRKDDKIYLHVFNWPKDGKLIIGGMKSEIGRAYLLSDPRKDLKINKLNQLDKIISVKLAKTDSVNTVIVLVPKGVVKTDTIRLLGRNGEKNRLLAFDANLHGKGLSFGDGKTDRYYVQGWKQKDQWLSWNVRLNEPAEFDITLKCTGSKKSGGTYILEVAGQQLKATIPSFQKDGAIKELKPGKIKLPAGNFEITLKPFAITGQDLMQPLEVILE